MLPFGITRRVPVVPVIEAEPQPNVGWDKLASSAGPPQTRLPVSGGPALEASLSHPTKCTRLDVSPYDFGGS